MLEQLRYAWARTTGNQRIALAGVIGVAAIVAFVAFNAASAPDYAVAFTNLRNSRLVTGVRSIQKPSTATRWTGASSG